MSDKNVIDLSEVRAKPSAEEVQAEKFEEPEVKRFLQDGINQHIECRLCAAEIPPGVSMMDYSWLGAGFTSRGFQVVCQRHDINVLHLDFKGEVLQGSGNADPEDYLAASQVAPKLLEETEFTVAAAGLALAKARMLTHKAKPSIVLRAYVAELRDYLRTLELQADWQVAHDAMTGKGTTIITPPGVRGL